MKELKSLQDKAFIKVLKDKRLTNDPQLSQRDVAKIAGVSFGSVQNFEAGEKVRETTAFAIANALGFEIETRYIVKEKKKEKQLKGQTKIKLKSKD